MFSSTLLLPPADVSPAALLIFVLEKNGLFVTDTAVRTSAQAMVTGGGIVDALVRCLVES